MTPLYSGQARYTSVWLTMHPVWKWWWVANLSFRFYCFHTVYIVLVPLLRTPPTPSPPPPPPPSCFPTTTPTPRWWLHLREGSEAAGRCCTVGPCSTRWRAPACTPGSRSCSSSGRSPPRSSPSSTAPPRYPPYRQQCSTEDRWGTTND